MSLRKLVATPFWLSLRVSVCPLGSHLGRGLAAPQLSQLQELNLVVVPRACRPCEHRFPNKDAGLGAWGVCFYGAPRRVRVWVSPETGRQLGTSLGPLPPRRPR